MTAYKQVPLEPTTEMLGAGMNAGEDRGYRGFSVGSARWVYSSMLSAAPEPTAEDGWQPIETAPKDGTEIIGLFVRRWEPDQKPTIYGPWTVAFVNGSWQSSWDGARVIEYMSDFGIEYKDPDISPTHWQPLPAPPALSNQKG